jgi:AhpD family alkylhydroperoxidase
VFLDEDCSQARLHFQELVTKKATRGSTVAPRDSSRPDGFSWENTPETVSCPGNHSHMDKIDEIRRQRRHAHDRLLGLKSKVYEAFLAMEAATYTEGAISRKNKELVAVGISVVIHCESCMEWHIVQSAKQGASSQEVLEAIEVGIEMGGGPATVSARFALEVMDEVYPSKPVK